MSRSFGLLASVAIVFLLSARATAQERSSKSSTPIKTVAKTQDVPVDVATAQEAAQPAEEVRPALPNARGFYISADGVVTGQVTTIDQGSGNLLPLPFAVVSFMQNRRFITQGRTNRNGQFSVRGLTPWATYSVIVLSRDSVALVGAIIRPEGGGAAPPADKAAQNSGRNEIRLVGTSRLASAKLNIQADDGLVIQGMPRDDFFTAVQSGLFGDPGAFGGGAGPGMGGGGGGSGGGSGGGGSGGGGGGGGGLGGLLAGAAGAIGFAAAASEGFGDDDAITPFGVGP